MITKDIKYVGVNDHKIDLFEGQYIVPNGMAYNSYIIKDEKTAVMDSVDINFAEEWINNIKAVLTAAPDYLIIQHMEPDHSSSIAEFKRVFPTTTIVATDKAFTMMSKFFQTDYADNRIVVKEGDTLNLGEHTLNFIMAPMVHWPEVMMTYDSTDKVLFSADGFGKFGALDVEEDWACEARRYIQIICPLHGPVLNENLGYYLNLYDIWSSYGVESEGVLICYTSIYGNTKRAVELLAEELKAQGCVKVAVNDLARCDMAEAVEDAFRYGKIVLATTTYNGSIFPFMHTFINELLERGYKNRKIGIIENGSWAPVAANTIKKMFENSKNITFTDTTVTVHSSLKAENTEQIKNLAKEII